jgi:hypothetical protein
MRKSKGKADSDNHNIIDLATSVNTSLASDIKYVCKECEGSQVLREYPQAQLYNPHAGKCYICPACSRIYDSSLEKLPKATKKVVSNLGAGNVPTTPIIETIQENAGIEREDEYAKYDPEGDTDERMKMQGFHIVESKLELTDSQGRNRTIFKRID